MKAHDMFKKVIIRNDIWDKPSKAKKLHMKDVGENQRAHQYLAINSQWSQRGNRPNYWLP